MDENHPPTYTVAPETARERTSSRPGFLACAFHPVARPLLASMAAISTRGRPPAEVKDPPRKTFGPERAMARTVSFAPGFHDVARPLAPPMAATCRRVLPPMALKVPPA